MFTPQDSSTKFICVVCKDEFSGMPWGGYCDYTLECCQTAELFDVDKGIVVSM